MSIDSKEMLCNIYIHKVVAEIILYNIYIYICMKTSYTDISNGGVLNVYIKCTCKCLILRNEKKKKYEKKLKCENEYSYNFLQD